MLIWDAVDKLLAWRLPGFVPVYCVLCTCDSMSPPTPSTLLVCTDVAGLRAMSSASASTGESFLSDARLRVAYFCSGKLRNVPAAV